MGENSRIIGQSVAYEPGEIEHSKEGRALELASRVESGNSIKYLWRLADDAYVESVAFEIRERVAAWEIGAKAPLSLPRSRVVCVSSQAGCALACRFCATALQPTRRNLTRDEILWQVQSVIQDFPSASPIGVTFAGMGEPLLNADEVFPAIETLLRSDNIRRVSLSTVGIVPGLEQLLELEAKPYLFISLHAANDDLRSKIMPVNTRYPISTILPLGEQFARAIGRRTGISYLLLEGVNDSEHDAEALARLLGTELFTVQVLMWNPVPDFPFSRVSRERADWFVRKLKAANVPAYIMESEGRDISAACGQLVTQETISPRQRAKLIRDASLVKRV